MGVYIKMYKNVTTLYHIPFVYYNVLIYTAVSSYFISIIIAKRVCIYSKETVLFPHDKYL